MAGLLKGRTNQNDNSAMQRKEILKRGLIGIIVVLFLAFAASFFGGGDDKAPQAKNDTEKDSSEEISLDTSSLLNDDANQAQSSSTTQIPASRRFDYRGMDENDSQNATLGELDANTTQRADAPITPVEPIAPLATPSNNTTEQNGGNTELALPAENVPFDADENKFPPASNALAPQTSNEETKAQEVKPQSESKNNVTSSTKAVLYCGNFVSSSKAEEQKALMAFQGLSSQVVKHGSSYVLKLGPYKSRDAARKVFSRLDADGLVSECSLESD